MAGTIQQYKGGRHTNERLVRQKQHSSAGKGVVVTKINQGWGEKATRRNGGRQVGKPGEGGVRVVGVKWRRQAHGTVEAESQGLGGR